MQLRTKQSIIGAVALFLLPIGAGASRVDAFFETEFDGGWVGTIATKTDTLPLLLHLDVQDDGGTAVVFISPAGSGDVDLLSGAITEVGATEVVIEYDDAGAALRRDATTLTLQHDPVGDLLEGEAKGSVKGTVTLTRMGPSLPLQRIWTGSFKSGGATVQVVAQLQEDPGSARGRFAPTPVSGFARVGDEQGAVQGTRNGGSVDLTVQLPSGDVDAALKLKRKNSQLKGTFGGQKLKLVPAGSNNGKPMKVKSTSPGEIEAGTTGVVAVKGKNFGAGATAYADDTGIEVLEVEVVSPKAIDVMLRVADTIADGTAIALRIVNGDGQTSDRARALTVTADDGGGGGGPTVSFASDVQPIFTANCALAGCHSAASAQQGLILQAGQALASIVNVASRERPDLDRIEPGDPDRSYLVMKIRGDSGIVGGQMPLGRTPLSAAQIATIVTWVQEGAANNRPAR